MQGIAGYRVSTNRVSAARNREKQDWPRGSSQSSEGGSFGQWTREKPAVGGQRLSVKALRDEWVVTSRAPWERDGLAVWV